MLKRFTYQKANGEISHRVVHVISPASDNMLAIDLSEFDKEDQDSLDAALQQIHNDYLERINSELGLINNWRAFKTSRIVQEG